MTTVVVDYGRGNLYSLGHALRTIGAPYRISDDPTTLGTAKRVILPGVGAFPDAMAELEQRGFLGPLREYATEGRPLLGICLGMQLLASASDEFEPTMGLDLIRGRVRHLPPRTNDATGTRVPNVGWRALRFHENESAFASKNRSLVYFAHSFAVETDTPSHTLASISVNSTDAAAIIRAGHVIGFQFHPEKSGPTGLDLLREFVADVGLRSPEPEEPAT